MGVRESLECFGALLCAGVTANAQTYPNKELTVVVGLPAGSGGDVIARYYGNKLSELAGKPVIVENKPGMILSMGADHVAKAQPDGYTILRTHTTAFPGDSKTLAAFLPTEIERWRELSRVAKIVPQ